MTSDAANLSRHTNTPIQGLPCVRNSRQCYIHNNNAACSESVCGLLRDFCSGSPKRFVVEMIDFVCRPAIYCACNLVSSVPACTVSPTAFRLTPQDREGFAPRLLTLHRISPRSQRAREARGSRVLEHMRKSVRETGFVRILCPCRLWNPEPSTWGRTRLLGPSRPACARSPDLVMHAWLLPVLASAVSLAPRLVLLPAITSDSRAVACPVRRRFDATGPAFPLPQDLFGMTK